MSNANQARRKALSNIAMGMALGPWLLSGARAAEDSLISESDPDAKALNYVADARKSKEAKPGNTCVNCSLYSGGAQSTQAACVALNNKLVKAAGWCTAWTNM